MTQREIFHSPMIGQKISWRTVWFSNIIKNRQSFFNFLVGDSRQISFLTCEFKGIDQHLFSLKSLENHHCVKSVCIRSHSGPHFSCIFSHSEWMSIYPYSVQMRENAGKMRTRITPNTDSFHAVHRFSDDFRRG